MRLKELLGEVGIISKYNHPNIVMYYTCWIELANLDEVNQMSLVYREVKREEEQERLEIDYM